MSSADWDIPVDAEDSRSAAISAVIFVFNKYNKKLLMSTTIMVNEEKEFKEKSLNSVDFFATHDILNEIGLKDMSKNFLELTKNINEIKSIR